MQWVVEIIAKSEVGKVRGKGDGNFLIEVGSKFKMSEGKRERLNFLIEVVSKSKIGESRWSDGRE